MRLVFGGALLVALSACTNADTLPEVSTPLDEAPDAESLESFDQVWNQVRTQYFDYPRIAEDWEQARELLRPKAAQASSAEELRPVLTELLAGVGESHFGVMAGSSQGQLEAVGSSQVDDDASSDGPPQSTSTGLSARLINQSLTITKADDPDNSPIRAGWTLEAFGDQAMQPLIDEIESIDDPTAQKRSMLILQARVNSRLAYPREGEVLELRLRDAAGDLHEVNVQGRPGGMKQVEFGNLPALSFEFTAQRIEKEDGCIGVMAFTAWVPELVDEFLDVRNDLFECQGLVIDLRGNLGGVIATMVPLTAHLVDEPVLLGRLVRADGRIDFRAFPRRVADDGVRLTPYAGPVAILIDGLSASTSEMFASGMQSLGRARIIGQRSPGMALPAQMLPLKNGDVLMYAFADYHDGQGRRVEGIGVVPDQIVEQSADALVNKDDAELDTALAWLLQTTAAP
ncbi:MAG: S41 family peptidase [Woeseiaceae bacterium]|nr:S41 family peptidase [Woeseiaceae bacterium]